MTREELIEALIEDDFRVIEWAPEFLDSILMNGFKGYGNQTDEELEQEYNDRFLLSSDELMSKLENE